MKTAPSGHYTLQLSSSSNYDNLNNWAKKEKLDKYVVYETSRNGQPWYVLVSGIYASKDEAKRAVTSLPADVRARAAALYPDSNRRLMALRELPLDALGYPL